MKPKKKPSRGTLRNYTETVYGARVPYEDSRVLDDYARIHHLNRGDLVRHALHDFVLKQQMLYSAKLKSEEPEKPLTRQTLAEHLVPLQTRLAQLAETLTGSLTAELRAPPGATLRAGAGVAGGRGGASQQLLLEQILATVSLVLRLQINYLVSPVVQELVESNPVAVGKEYQEAAGGRQVWPAATLEVVDKTEQRVLDELAYEGLVPPSVGAHK